MPMDKKLFVVTISGAMTCLADTQQEAEDLVRGELDRDNLDFFAEDSMEIPDTELNQVPLGEEDGRTVHQILKAIDEKGA